MRTRTSSILLASVVALGAAGALARAQQGSPSSVQATASNPARGLDAYRAGDFASAMNLLRPLAEQGDGEAAFVCGLMAQHGRGVKAEPEQAARFYTLGADRGHDKCLNNLGVLYREGSGVAKDPAKAAELFRKAALKGNDDAALSLGALYVNGDGVASDYAEAAAWYTLAADRGNAAAKANLDELRPHMSAEQLRAAATRAEAIRADIAAAAKPAAPRVQAGGGSDLGPAPTATPSPSPAAPPASGPFAWRALTGPANSGAVLAAEPQGMTSATDMLKQAAASLSARLGSRPVLLGAIVDAQDATGQSQIEFSADGRSKRGLLIVRSTKASGGPRAGFIYDDAQSLPTSGEGLLQTLRAAWPAEPAPPAAPRREIVWQTVQLPDGSGSIRLPQGWVVTGAYQGIVDASGPEGAVSLGGFFQVMTPAAAAAYWAKPPLVADYTDPERGAREVLAQLAQTAQQTGQVWVEVGRVRDKTPVPWQNGQAVMADVEYTINGNVNGEMVRKASRGLVLWGMAPINNEQWLFYQSAVGSTPEDFPKNLPVLLEIWKGWRISDATIKARLDAAVKSMQDVNRIIQETGQNRAEAMDRSAEAWSHCIRGDWPVVDTRYDRRGDLDISTLNKTVEWMNQQEGYERYRIVPYAELNRWTNP